MAERPQLKSKIAPRPSKADRIPQPTTDPIATAMAMLERGWKPIPVPFREKAPIDQGWHTQQINRENVSQHFAGQMNLGVQLGAASGGLTDVDLDCAEAIALANDLLPPTVAIFGRESKKGSHRLYITDLWKTENKAVIKYSAPKTLGGDPKQTAVLVELRIGTGEKGTQTIVPGSVHPSGEPVRWDVEGEPATVHGDILKRAVATLAAAALLVRHYPAQGKRHDAALVLGGLLARKPGIEPQEIERFVSLIARAAGDEEAVERGRSAAGAVNLLKAGEPAPGLPRMREEWGNEVADTVANWLNIKDGDDSASEEQSSADRTAKAKQTDVLIAIAVKEASFFHSPDRIGFAEIRIHDHRETWELTSKGFRHWLPLSGSSARSLFSRGLRDEFDREKCNHYRRIVASSVPRSSQLRPVIVPWSTLFRPRLGA